MEQPLEPQIARIPQVGDWWTACCKSDLVQILTAGGLEDALAWREDMLAGEGAFVGSWPTFEEAKADLMRLGGWE